MQNKRHMDQFTVLVASGLRSRMESLDMLSHNIANSSTAGFKADREMYRQYFSEEALGEAAVSPVIEGKWTDFSQGPLTASSSQLDFGLSGKGYFVAKGPSGPLYTRNGNFQFSKDGKLTTAEGYEVEIKTADGQPAKLNPRLDLQVAPDGTMRQGGAPVGRLSVVDFASQTGFEKRAGNYFSFSAAQPIEARGVDIRQGTVEASNVNAPEMAVRLVNVMRQFEMLNRALAINGEMTKKTIDDIARVS